LLHIEMDNDAKYLDLSFFQPWSIAQIAVLRIQMMLSTARTAGIRSRGREGNREGQWTEGVMKHAQVGLEKADGSGRLYW
jgi:hypothetical protein